MHDVKQKGWWYTGQLFLQELLGLELEESGAVEEREEDDSGDVLWDLHDEQEQIEAFQQACSNASRSASSRHDDSVITSVLFVMDQAFI